MSEFPSLLDDILPPPSIPRVTAHIFPSPSASGKKNSPRFYVVKDELKSSDLGYLGSITLSKSSIDDSSNLKPPLDERIRLHQLEGKTK